MTTMTLRLDPAMAEKLAVAASVLEQSISDTVRDAISEYLSAREHVMAPDGGGQGMRRCTKCGGIEANYDPKTPLCTGVSPA